MEFAPPEWRPIRVAAVVDSGAGATDPDTADAGAMAHLDAALGDAPDVALERVTPERVLERLEATCVRMDPDPERVDCVLCPSDPGEWETAAFVAAVREADPDVPVIVHPETGSVDEAADVTAAGASRYLRQPGAATDATGGDDPDATTELLEAVRDVADRHDAVRNDRLCGQLLRVILDDLQLAIFFKDRDGRHVAASARIASAQTESVLGKTDLDLYEDDIGEQARSGYRDDLAVARDGERIVEKEERHEARHGEVNWLRTTKVPWFGPDDERRGLIGITETIDEAKARETELERERHRLEAFASFASHDLRNPVSIASGYLGLARETGNPTALENVEESLQRMATLIDDVLALVQPEDTDETMAWLHLRDAIEHAWERIDAPRASLSVAVPEGVAVLAADGLFTQLLENLLKNSVQHVGPTVAIEVGLTATGFYVADDGPGIDAEDPARVFDYGYTNGGTGLGLAIVDEVAEYHRWEPSVGEPIDDAVAVPGTPDGPPGSRGYDGACFALERCILRTDAHRRATECDPVDLEESVDVGPVATAGAIQRLEPGSVVDGVDEPAGPAAWRVDGGGKNLWRDIEEYHLGYANVQADVRIVARAVDVERVSEYSKAGLLVGDWPAEGHPLSFLGTVGAHGCESIHRQTADDVLSIRNHSDRSAVPIWLRLDRVGPRVTCYLSTDGEDWAPVDQHVLDLDGSVVAGLAVCSHNASSRSTAVFDHVRITPLSTDSASAGGLQTTERTRSTDE
ncbi:ATP-binding protein [Salinarchaeum laminariae]|uniref:ATP-binding protein n=1 Tax=Salinarchaeum laminariae TaxID=869888 RepID=UPI0020C13DB5|nr:ATP-binding protein [Salinarchaeum laminariae]